MKSLVISSSFPISFTQNTTQSITQNDILYVAQQVKRDLKALSKSYKNILSLDYADDLHDYFTTFLINNAVSDIGFSIYDPENLNLVYHEYRYKVLLGGDVLSLTGGNEVGTGGCEINPVFVPSSAKFTPWVKWSSKMLDLSKDKQKSIVSGTGWLIPGENPTFNTRYEGGSWNSLGIYARGSVGVDGKVWKKQ